MPVSYRIEAVVGFNAIPMLTPPVYHTPFYGFEADNLGCLGVLTGSLDFDFQGVEAKIEMSYGGVMLTVCERVGGERFISDDVFVGLATAKYEDWEQVNGN